MQIAPQRRGFTLIELLVVIAIISILASILFPVFSRARAKARQTACTSNVKQLLTALHMYTQDYDECFPYTFIAGSAGHYNPAEWQWYDAIYAYTRNRDIYICPELKTVIPGYGMNSALSGQSIGIMYDAAKKILVIDFADPSSLGSPHGQCQIDYTLGPDDPLLKNKYATRHNDGYVVGYGDGHAKFARPDNLRSNVYWDPTVES
ncbi:MAG: type II secretion system protein [Candidatus Zipacnadales bacterium]